VLNRLRNGDIRILVATDVAARGIDIPALSHVFLYEPPEDRESYIHRAGRTGRAGAAGTVISLVDIMQKLELMQIAQYYHISMQQIAEPSEEEATYALGNRVLATLENSYRKLGTLDKEHLEQLIPLAKQIASNAESLPLIAMLLAETYRKITSTVSLPHDNPQKAPKQKKASPKAKKKAEKLQTNIETAPVKEAPQASVQISPTADTSIETQNNSIEKASTAQNTVSEPSQQNANSYQEKADFLAGIPAYLREFIDSDGIDIAEGMEDKAPATEQNKRRRHHIRRRRPSSK